MPSNPMIVGFAGPVLSEISRDYPIVLDTNTGLYSRFALSEDAPQPTPMSFGAIKDLVHRGRATLLEQPFPLPAIPDPPDPISDQPLILWVSEVFLRQCRISLPRLLKDRPLRWDPLPLPDHPENSCRQLWVTACTKAQTEQVSSDIARAIFQRLDTTFATSATQPDEIKALAMRGLKAAMSSASRADAFLRYFAYLRRHDAGRLGLMFDLMYKAEFPSVTWDQLLVDVRRFEDAVSAGSATAAAAIEAPARPSPSQIVVVADDPVSRDAVVASLADPAFLVRSIDSASLSTFDVDADTLILFEEHLTENPDFHPFLAEAIERRMLLFLRQPGAKGPRFYLARPPILVDPLNADLVRNRVRESLDPRPKIRAPLSAPAGWRPKS